MISVGILAGGQSRRMGKDKAFLPVGKQMVIERVLQRVTPLSDDLIVVTNTPHQYRERLSSYFKQASHRQGPADLPQPSDGQAREPAGRLVKDIFPGKGSLGGIYTALHAAQHASCLVVACDMPFLNQDLLGYLIDQLPGYDVVMPHIGEFLEPTHAVYHKNCLAPIRRLVEANQLKIRDFLADVRVRIVEYDEIAHLDPDCHSFINMNTPAEWKQAQAMATNEA